MIHWICLSIFSHREYNYNETQAVSITFLKTQYIILFILWFILEKHLYWFSPDCAPKSLDITGCYWAGDYRQVLEWSGAEMSSLTKDPWYTFTHCLPWMASLYGYHLYPETVTWYRLMGATTTSPFQNNFGGKNTLSFFIIALFFPPLLIIRYSDAFDFNANISFSKSLT